MRLVVAITGASGAILGIRFLELLQSLGIETHLIISKWGQRTIIDETSYSLTQVKGLANSCYDDDDLSAPPASGSFHADGMAIIPCSMKTLAKVACGLEDTLIARAADVTIKEGRRLALVVREAPLSAIHLENMLKLARLGVTIFPPVPAFYLKSQSLDEMIQNVVKRVAAVFDRGASSQAALEPGHPTEG